MTDAQRLAVGWFEIPVKDMDRAMAFYQTVFGYTLQRHALGELDMAWFPMPGDLPGATGALVYNEEFYTPSNDGVVLYFTAQSGDLQNELGRVEEAGGSILQPKKALGEYGFMALVTDTEGNRIALHSRQ